MGVKKDKYQALIEFQDTTRVLTETTVGSMTDLNLSEATHSIDSVSDSGGNALFVVTGGPTLSVGQEVIIIGFTGGNVGYNGTFTITSLSSGDFQTGVAFAASEASGSFIALVDRRRILVVDDGYKQMYESLFEFIEDDLAPNFHDTVQTTNNTTTTITTIPLTDGVNYRIRVELDAVEGTANRAYYESIAVCSAAAGTAAVDASHDNYVIAESTASWGGTSFTTSGANVLVQVTGIAATTIDWTSIVRVEIIP